MLLSMSALRCRQILSACLPIEKAAAATSARVRQWRNTSGYIGRVLAWLGIEAAPVAGETSVEPFGATVRAPQPSR